MEPDYSSSTDLSIISESENIFSHFCKNFSSSKVCVDKKKSKNEKLDEIFKYFEDKLEKFKKSKATTNVKEDKEKIDELIEKGCDVDFKTKRDNNVLHLVAEVKPNEDSVKLYKYLIKKGCQTIINYYGINVLHSAALSDNQLLIKYLFESSGKENEFINSKTYGGFQTPLHLAAKTGANNAILCLIENGADKEAKDYLGRTPLYLAAEYGQEETVKLFLEKGCEVNVVSKNGQKALFWIVAKCRNLAPDILDTYRELDKYNFKDTYDLKAVELELIKKDKDVNTDELEKNKNEETLDEIPKIKSILEHIVEQYDLELITHPVIKKLIGYKWRRYRFWSFFRFFIDLLFSVIWNLWSVLIPYHERHIYNSPKDTVFPCFVMQH
ncbi:unnamed protein product [Brachionus calyciflorus]|uniref:Uncharacterized protein n=1 Tax=Brachionus calyciflorus TaxID=104777 RepID=A0A814MLY4_9BILA|nr:unnamed protein product [Brachionus calyciflorus]